MMDERREKQQLQKVLSELREAHRGLREEVELLREENKRLKELCSSRLLLHEYILYDMI